jgi:ribose 5-phosphate isomerase
MIKGAGPCCAEVASITRRQVVIVGAEKVVVRRGVPLPVEVVPFAQAVIRA